VDEVRAQSAGECSYFDSGLIFPVFTSDGITGCAWIKNIYSTLKNNNIGWKQTLTPTIHGFSIRHDGGGGDVDDNSMMTR